MLKSKKASLFLILIPLSVLSCWGDTSPTSGKDSTVRVGGVVADKTGAGIPSVTVQITGTNYSITDTTDAGGAFNFKKIPSGSYTVKATKESNVFKPSVLNIIVEDSNIDTLRFIAAENRLHGKVMDIITNKGMPDIKIIIYGDNTPFKDSTTTNINGEYEFFNLPKNDYSIDTNFYDMYHDGHSSPYQIKVKTEDFAHPDISLPIFNMSSEVLKFTNATFSVETNTVHLEWTPSRSNFFDRYLVDITDKLPFGTSGVKGDNEYQTNSANIKITPKYRASINNAKIIHFSVRSYYYVDRVTYTSFNGPYSEPVSIQVAE